MTQVKFEVSIDASNENHAKALKAFLDALSDKSTEATKVETAEEDKPKKVKKTTVKKTEDAATEDAATEETSTEETAPEKEATESSVQEEATEEQNAGGTTITEVRKLLASKVTQHREQIKNKLTALGATSVTTLKESSYTEFYDFLNSL